MATVAVHPEADLASRPNAHEPTRAELAQIELFQQLSRVPDIAKYPHSMVLRRMAKGEVVCRQGEAGASAFYILTSDDVIRLKKHQLETAPNAALGPDAQQGKDGQAELSLFEQRKKMLAGLKQDDPQRCIATAHLLVDSTTSRRYRPPGLMARIKRLLGVDGASTRLRQPSYISIDGPSDVDYATRTAPMHEGEIFGEMSCMTFAPRSATVVANCDCYMLEFLRSIFDQIQRDKGYQQRTEEVYRERALNTQFSRMELFDDLTEEDLKYVRQHAHLEVLEPGEVVCDEGDEAHAVYLIRSGLAQVVINANARLAEEDIRDWHQLCAALIKGAPAEAGGEKSKVTSAMTATPQATAARKAVEPPAASEESGKKKIGTADILAAARGGKPAETKPTDVSESAPVGGQPAESRDAKNSAEQQETSEPSVSEKIALARGSQADDADVPHSDTPPAGAPADSANMGFKQLSVKEKLAMIRQAKSAGGSPQGDAGSSTSKATRERKSSGKAGKPAKGKPSALDALKKNKPVASSPQQHLWQFLPARVRVAIRQIARGAAKTDRTLDADPGTKDDQRPSPRVEKLRADLAAKSEAKREKVWSAQKSEILAALNDVLRKRDFCTGQATAELRDTHADLAPVRAFGKKEKDWTGMEIRLAGRLLLQAISDGAIRPPTPAGLAPRTLAYLSRGDIFGEIGVAAGLLTKMGLMEQAGNKRMATVIAFDHPDDGSGRKPSRLEMIRLDKDVFMELMTRSAPLRNKVASKVQQRLEHTHQVAEEQPWERDTLLESKEYRDLGFAQGQRLLLIDLDRCTRCGDCVRACINTHDDGYTRLFLDGPRFDRFLVPSACRNCRDPACMIGCPVGSIQRGDNGEILIREWCIGCSLCADQCPYDSIQMHDHGIIPQQALGWYVLPADKVQNDSWRTAGYRPQHWLSMMTPVRCDPSFVTALSSRLDSRSRAPLSVCFRYSFEGSHLRHVGQKLSFFLVSKGTDAQLWLNGKPVALQQDAKQKRKGEFTAAVPNTLARGENVVAAQVTLPVAEGEPVLALRLDAAMELHETPAGVEEAEAKQVTQRAVVCDLCSSLPSQEPACVAQCPHDAAFRIDGLTNLDRMQSSLD